MHRLKLICTTESQLILLSAFIHFLQPHVDQLTTVKTSTTKSPTCETHLLLWGNVSSGLCCFNHNVVWVSHSEAILNTASHSKNIHNRKQMQCNHKHHLDWKNEKFHEKKENQVQKLNSLRKMPDVLPVVCFAYHKTVMNANLWAQTHSLFKTNKLVQKTWAYFKMLYSVVKKSNLK